MVRTESSSWLRLRFDDLGGLAGDGGGGGDDVDGPLAELSLGGFRPRNLMMSFLGAPSPPMSLVMTRTTSASGTLEQREPEKRKARALELKQTSTKYIEVKKKTRMLFFLFFDLTDILFSVFQKLLADLSYFFIDLNNIIRVAYLRVELLERGIRVLS